MSSSADSASGRRPTAGDLARLGGPPGLCATCRHAAVLASRTSVFLRCGLAERDPAFPRYPRLPVVVCAGYERSPEEGLPA
jgi:hypothetical protein